MRRRLAAVAAIGLGGFMMSGASGAIAWAAGAAPADPADARAISAWCVGGPAVPSYAFRYYDRAERCYQNVAAGSRDCAAYARLDRCWVYDYYDIGAYPPAQCICNPRIPPVGRW